MIRVTWGATGTPREVVAAIGDHARQARLAHPSAAPVIMAARDALWAAAQRHAADAVVVVAATIDLSVVAGPAPQQGAPQAEAADPAPSVLVVPPVRARTRWVA